ncbi:MAG: DUF3795 domain-containing protein [Planctomycetaceae bacterium]|nr:DUF3795 domain-containing protein [Planctomycetaceae bacterium]
MDNLKYVTYCGLYCKLCAEIARIPAQASALQQTLKKSGWEIFGHEEVPEFKVFCKALNFFSKLNETCPGCRGGCGNPKCPIRKCIEEKKLKVCADCEQFPCEHFDRLTKKYPNLIADVKRQKEIGLLKWIEEQEKRCEAGACYMDFCIPAD